MIPFLTEIFTKHHLSPHRPAGCSQALGQGLFPRVEEDSPASSLSTVVVAGALLEELKGASVASPSILLLIWKKREWRGARTSIGHLLYTDHLD